MDQQLLKRWGQVTGELPWGVQRAFVDALTLAKDEKIHLVYGANYRDGKPCLVNSVASMLPQYKNTPADADKGQPSQYFGAMVSLFDEINHELATDKVNDASGYVSPLAAEVLLRNFGPLKTVEQVTKETAKDDAPYVEPSDEALARDFLAAMQAPAPSALDDLATLGDPAALHLKGLQGK